MTDWIRCDYNLLGRVRLFLVPRTFFTLMGVASVGELMTSPEKMEEFIKFFRGNGLPMDATLIRLHLPLNVDGVLVYVLSSEYPLVDPLVPIEQETFPMQVALSTKEGRA